MRGDLPPAKCLGRKVVSMLTAQLYMLVCTDWLMPWRCCTSKAASTAEQAYSALAISMMGARHSAGGLS